MCLVAGQLLTAGEVSYQETTKITGGSILKMMKFAGAFSKDARKMGEPVVTTVAIKGNRMIRSSNDFADITDLDAQTVTHIDKIKHQYSVVTFAQMHEAMQRAMDKAQQEQPKADAQAATPQTAKDPNVELGFDVHVRKTGASKQVSNLDTDEIILTLSVNAKDKTNGQQGAFAMTNDMWMAPQVPAYDQVRDFEKRLAAAMAFDLTPSPQWSAVLNQAQSANQPQSSDALKAMAKEMSQIQGVPVLQVMRMGTTVNGQPLPAASEAALPVEGNGPTVGDAVAKSGEDTAQQTAAAESSQRIRGAFGNSLGSAIGGFGGFGHKKKQQQQQQEASSDNPSASAAPPQSVVLIESVTELGNFSDQVDPAVFEVPSGYKQVTALALKGS